MMPLDPTHLLYACIGEKLEPRGTVMPRVTTQSLKEIIAKRAFRAILSHYRDPEAMHMQTRLIDSGVFTFENEEWANWHEGHSNYEKHGATR